MNSSQQQIFTLYNENKDELCDRPVLGRAQPCGGKQSLEVEVLKQQIQYIIDCLLAVKIGNIEKRDILIVH